MTSVYLPKYGPHLEMFYMESTGSRVPLLSCCQTVRCHHSSAVSLNSECSQPFGKATSFRKRTSPSIVPRDKDHWYSFPCLPRCQVFILFLLQNPCVSFNNLNFTFFQSFPVLTQSFIHKDWLQEGQKHFYRIWPERHTIFRNWSGLNSDFSQFFKMGWYNFPSLLSWLIN